MPSYWDPINRTWYDVPQSIVDAGQVSPALVPASQVNRGQLQELGGTPQIGTAVRDPERPLSTRVASPPRYDLTDEQAELVIRKFIQEQRRNPTIGDVSHLGVSPSQLNNILRLMRGEGGRGSGKVFEAANRTGSLVGETSRVGETLQEGRGSPRVRERPTINGVPDPSPITAEEIERDFKRGIGADRPILTADEAARLLAQIGIANPAAVVAQWERGGSGTFVTFSDLMGQEPAGDGAFELAPLPLPAPAPALEADTPMPVPARSLIPPPPLSGAREEGFREQSEADRRRRILGSQFGYDRTPLGENIAGSLYNQFRAQTPLFNFGLASQMPAQAFGEFLANRPTAEDLTRGMDLILTGGAQSPYFRQAFPDVESVARTASQPFLQRLNPFIRPDIGNILYSDVMNQVVQTPELYQNPQERFKLLRDLVSDYRSKGYIN